VTLVVVAGCAVVAVSLMRHSELAGVDHSVLESAAAEDSQALSSALQRYDDLVVASAEQLGSGLMNGEQFQGFFRGTDMRSRYPGMIEIGFISYVPSSQLAAFESSEAAGGMTGSSVQRSGARPFYCIGSVAESSGEVGSQPMIGFDFCSASWLKQALLGSLRTGRETVVSERSLGSQYRSDFAILVPYPSGSQADTGKISGWSVALVDGKSLLDAISPKGGGNAVFALYEGTGDRGVPLASQPSAGSSVAGTASNTFDAGPTWTLRSDLLSGYPGLVRTWADSIYLLSGGLLFVIALGLFGWMLDSSRSKAEREARKSREAREASEVRFETIADASPIGILEATGELEIAYANSALERISGYKLPEFVGSSWLQHVHSEDRPSFLELARAAADGRQRLTAQFRIVRPSGEARTVRLVTAGLRLGGGDVRTDRYVATIEDVTEELALQDRVRHQALHDPVTDLPNRVLFVDRLEEALHRATRAGSGLAVLLLDVDRFNVINDSLGHKAGDELLNQLADRLRRVARAGETLARFSGDEFMLLLTDVPSADTAVTVARRILHATETPFQIEGHEIVASVSIGIVLPHPGEDTDAVIREADAALFRAKEEGRARYAIFQERLHEKSVERLNLEEQLRRAIERDELRVYYQPIVALPSEEVVGAEALVRWQHPSRGLLGPAEFIHLAEETGLILPLGQWVFTRAISQIREWDDREDAPHLPTIAVNFSTKQLRHTRLSLERQRLVAAHRLSPSRICVEVTETAVMDDDDGTRRTLRMMEEAGVEIAIDDFGTGYSAFSYLQTLPVSTLKVDRSFVTGIGSSRESDAVVAAIIEMAHRLGLRTVAEGVEEDSQREKLVELGCDAVQGFLWTQPLPPDEFAKWCALSPERRRSSGAPAR
jgi:diguanylate cyclase (GGDEF)-like protein/PAS domain S-box-containing protein